MVSAPLRPLLILLGGVSIVLGSIGIFIPMLPTVPFLLLAAWSFSRSSPKLRAWLFEHPRLGPYLCNFLQRKGLTRTQLHRCLLGKWAGISLAIYLAPIMAVKVGLFLIATSVSIYLLRLKRLAD
ncbi:YbaN family protein [Ferrimonas pelagia]|uniref:Inner membrane protein n=1 Tax=Ferrimonas pelagia TaxID=1177826 RepID=A0ABP9EWS1_9GAMM